MGEMRVGAPALLACVVVLGACGEDDGGGNGAPIAPITGPTAGTAGGPLAPQAGTAGSPLVPTAGAPAPVAGAGAAAGALPPTAGLPADSMAGTGPSPTDPAGDPTPVLPMGSEADYHDPGLGEWEMGTPEECGMDTGLITGSGNLAVFRYGKLCHVQGGDTSGPNWSATKTLGGVLAGRAAYLVKDVPRTGPGTGPILHEDLAVDWLGSVTYNRDAMLSQ